MTYDVYLFAVLGIVAVLIIAIPIILLLRRRRAKIPYEEKDEGAKEYDIKPPIKKGSLRVEILKDDANVVVKYVTPEDGFIVVPELGKWEHDPQAIFFKRVGWRRKKVPTIYVIQGESKPIVRGRTDRYIKSADGKLIAMDEKTLFVITERARQLGILQGTAYLEKIKHMIWIAMGASVFSAATVIYLQTQLNDLMKMLQHLLSIIK